MIPRHHVQDIMLHAERYVYFTSIDKHSHERFLLMVLFNICCRPLFMSILCCVHLCEIVLIKKCLAQSVLPYLEQM